MRSVRILMLAILCLSFAGSVFAQNPDTLWTRFFGGTSGDYGYSVQQTDDEGYILAGFTNSYGNGDSDFWMIKTNESGDTTWTRTYGGSSRDRGYSVIQTGDGGYLMTGYTDSFGNGDADVWLIKTNEFGDTVWTRTYGGIEDDEGKFVQQTSDGGYIIIGFTESFGAGAHDVWLLRLNASGDTLWTRTYGGSSSDEGMEGHQTSDGGYIIIGRTHSFSGSYDIWLIRADSNGDTLWTRTYGADEDDYGTSVVEISGGDFVISGHYYTLVPNNYHTRLYKVYADGTRGFFRRFQGIRTRSIKATVDGGYILIGDGSISNQVPPPANIQIRKTNGSGNLSWEMILQGVGQDYGHSIALTSDGGYIALGSTYEFGPGSQDFWLIKIESDLTRIADNDISSYGDLPSIENYPNPFNASTTIRYALPEEADVTIEIYDILGRRIETLVAGKQPAGSHTVVWEAKDVPSGVYFYRIEAGEYSQTQKCVLLK